MNSIDVVMLTKNSEHSLRQSLKSIYSNVPVERLIAVDGFSTDKTIGILNETNKKYGNIRILTEKGSRAQARERGVREVETEWFMFVDSDVILCRDWFRKAKKNTRKRVGAVWGLNVDIVPNIKSNFLLGILLLVARNCFYLRGGMHDTLIRRELVEDIKIPKQLHVYEDAYIVNWIKKKGYEAIIGDDIYCLHFRNPQNWNLKNCVSQVILELKCGLVFSRIFRYVFYYPFFMFYWLIQFLAKNA